MSREINDKIDNALFNFFLEADGGIVKEILQEDIQNLVEYEKKRNKFLFLAKAKVKQTHNESLLELANKFQEAIFLNIEKPIALLKQMIQGNPSVALYRNLDQMSKEDIIEIIRDKNLIDLIEQLNKDEKKL